MPPDVCRRRSSDLIALRARGMQSARPAARPVAGAGRAQESSPDCPPVSMHRCSGKSSERPSAQCRGKVDRSRRLAPATPSLRFTEVDLMTLIGSLVDNAIKYMNGGQVDLVVGTRDGGVVILSTTPVRASRRTSGPPCSTLSPPAGQHRDRLRTAGYSRSPGDRRTMQRIANAGLR